MLSKVFTMPYFANGAIAIGKGFAAWVTGSGAMLAAAIHSVAD